MLGRFIIVLGVFCGTLIAADQNALTSGLEQQSLRQLNEKALQAAIGAGVPGGQKPMVPLNKSLDDWFRATAQSHRMILKSPMQPMAGACAIPLLSAPIKKNDRFTMKTVPVPKTEDPIAKPAPAPACKE